MAAVKETGWFRLEGGTVQEMDLPLHEAVAQRVAKGEIKRVIPVEDGFAEYAEPEALPAVSDEVSADVQLSAALNRVTELEEELTTVTKERDELKELTAAKVPAPKPPKAKVGE